jgi:hypothetical protein
MHIDVVQEKNTEGTVVEVNATSTGGYSGPGTFSLRKHNMYYLLPVLFFRLQ